VILPEELLAYEHEVQGLRRTIDRLRDERGELKARIHAIGDTAGLPRDAKIEDVASVAMGLFLRSPAARSEAQRAYERLDEFRERDTVVPCARKVA
jgi:outer membrane murein-binding lipoprotein Lpp